MAEEENLDAILKRAKSPMAGAKQPKDIAYITLYLTSEECAKLLREAKWKLKGCKWVLEHPDRFKPEERQQVMDNAEKSGRFWEVILDKLTSQMG
jgi:hypothetical protein